MTSIAFENILSLILVKENIRPACLFQPTVTATTTVSSVLSEIISTFPTLIHSNNYTIYQGTIISKKNYNGRSNIKTEEMGKILGYPCYKGFNTLDRSKPYYTIEVVATLKNEHKYYILTNVCPDKSKLMKFTKFAEKAKRAFEKEKYKPLIGENYVASVDVVVKEEIPTQFIINKLIQNQELTKEEKDKIMNILYNFGFSIQLQLYFIENIQYNNPIHKGILLTLLLREINDIMSPFFPLQTYPEQDIKVGKITLQFEKELIAVLKKTSSIQYSNSQTNLY